METYLNEAMGDSTVAVRLMETDILLFSGEVIMLEKDLKKATARGDRYSAQYEEEKGNWFERLWESDAMKTIVFVLGVWMGIYASS
jgi:hypothetical protein